MQLSRLFTTALGFQLMPTAVLAATGFYQCNCVNRWTKLVDEDATMNACEELGGHVHKHYGGVKHCYANVDWSITNSCWQYKCDQHTAPGTDWDHSLYSNCWSKDWGARHVDCPA